MSKLLLDRRDILKGSMASAAAAMAPIGNAFAATFPSQNLKVMVATREGGGADHNLRAFWSIWKKYLKTEMEASFHPGGAAMCTELAVQTASVASMR